MGPYFFNEWCKKRPSPGWAQMVLRFFIYYLKVVINFPWHISILADCAIRIIHIFKWGKRG